MQPMHEVIVQFRRTLNENEITGQENNWNHPAWSQRIMEELLPAFKVLGMKLCVEQTIPDFDFYFSSTFTPATMQYMATIFRGFFSRQLSQVSKSYTAPSDTFEQWILHVLDWSFAYIAWRAICQAMVKDSRTNKHVSRQLIEATQGIINAEQSLKLLIQSHRRFESFKTSKIYQTWSNMPIVVGIFQK